jgi:hypothetical protein
MEIDIANTIDESVNFDTLEELYYDLRAMRINSYDWIREILKIVVIKVAGYDDVWNEYKVINDVIPMIDKDLYDDIHKLCLDVLKSTKFYNELMRIEYEVKNPLNYQI